MIFVIQYNQREGRLERIETFNDAEQEEANCRRTNIEIELLVGRISDEVVVLEARSIDALRKTHRRYFDSIDQWPDDFRESVGL